MTYAIEISLYYTAIAACFVGGVGFVMHLARKV
jgi:preprotein translocase subunit Sss1